MICSVIIAAVPYLVKLKYLFELGRIFILEPGCLSNLCALTAATVISEFPGPSGVAITINV